MHYIALHNCLGLKNPEQMRQLHPPHHHSTYERASSPLSAPCVARALYDSFRVLLVRVRGNVGRAHDAVLQLALLCVGRGE